MEATRLADAVTKLAELTKTLAVTTEQMAESFRAMAKATTMIKRIDPGLFAHPKYRHTEGRLRWGARLENTTTRQAEYTITVTESTPELFVVERSWGPLGAPGHHDVVVRSPDLTGAIHQARSIYDAKVSRRSYEDVGGYTDFDGHPELSDDESAWTSITERPLPASLMEDSAVDKLDPPERTCQCMNLFTEMAAQYTDVLIGTPAMAPLLTQPQSVMFRLPEAVGARWVVGVYAACSPGYDHVRAVPVGPEMTDDSVAKLNRRNKVEWVEDVVLRHLRPEHVRHLQSFGLLIEEDGPDLKVLDIWFGADRNSDLRIEEIVFSARYELLQMTWPSTFNVSTKFALAPLLTVRLREEFLDNESADRFELTDRTKKLPLLMARLPVLN